MKKIIYQNFLKETSMFFLISSFAVTIIVWVIQAVNYLDFVSEDGHSFKVYLFYTLLNFPKIFSRLMVFMFFISIFYTVSKYEEKNELLIFWVNGIKKKEFLNFVVKFASVLVLTQLILNLFVVPKTQDLARSYIRSSNIDYFPSLIKSKQFVSSVKGLTIFIEKKNENGELTNIFLKDNSEKNPQIISAKKGILKKGDNYFLVLYNGNIVDINEKGSNVISYDKTTIDLSGYKTQSIVDPKIQEQQTSLLINCTLSMYIYKIETSKINNLVCNDSSINRVTEELYKRFITPFYLFILAIVASCLILKSENDNNFLRFKIFVFISGIIFIVLSQTLTGYSSVINIKNSFIILMPFIVCAIFYFTLIFRLRE